MTFPERYTRQIILKGFGTEAQQKLQDAKVLVVGAGGLGVPALQYLAGMGVGTIGILDGDTVSASNLNRQVIYHESEVGMLKSQVATGKIAAQNPSISLKTFDTFLSVSNAIDILQQFDLIIDATDNFTARYLINDACIILNKTFIYGAIQEYEGHLSVFNYDEGPSYRCLYPTYPSPGEIPDCNTAGVLGVVPGIIGCYQALEAIKVITGIGKITSGYLKIFDLLTNESYEVKLKSRLENKQVVKLKDHYEEPACDVIPAINPAELDHWITSEKEFLLIDVREPEEYEVSHLEKSVLQSLSSFNTSSITELNHLPTVVLCQKGGRSLKAANLLHEKKPEMEVYFLRGGLEQWQKEMGKKFLVL